MGLPIHAASLFRLLKSLGIEQRHVAQQLRVTDGAVSWWATGKRAVSPRYERAFLDLVAQAIAPPSAGDGPGGAWDQHIAGFLWAWEAEMSGSEDGYTAAIRQVAARLLPLLTQDIAAFSRGERHAFGVAARQLSRLVSYTDLARALRPLEQWGQYPDGTVKGFADLRRQYREEEGDSDEGDTV